MSSRFWVSAATAALLLGCAQGEHSARRLEAGFLEHGAFRPLYDNEVLWVREGLQTGKWIMPSLRATGIASDADVTGEIVLEDGTVAGALTLALKFKRQEDGALLLDYVPIPIGAEEGGPSPVDVYGRAGTLHVIVDDGAAHALEYEQRVRLENGDEPEE